MAHFLASGLCAHSSSPSFKASAEAKAKALAEAKAKTEADAIAAAEARLKAKAEAELQAKTEAVAKARAKAEDLKQAIDSVKKLKLRELKTDLEAIGLETEGLKKDLQNRFIRALRTSSGFYDDDEDAKPKAEVPLPCLDLLFLSNTKVSRHCALLHTHTHPPL